ncbi:MAG TPA: hypothetical protein VF171_05825 [Trueperaceae bacterium]
MLETKTGSTISQVGIIVLVLAVAAIHFSRAAADADIRSLFILNGLGYLGLGALLYLPQTQNWRRAVRRFLMAYTALTAVLYILWGAMSGDWTLPLGPVNLLLELLLIGLLRQEASKRTR